MQFIDLLSLVGDLPLFETDLLLAGDVDPYDIRRQLSRWEKAGKIKQLRRGLYTLAPPYQKVSPHPFLIANALVPGSYVSLQTALAYYGLIPEYVQATLSMTPSRPTKWEGNFIFRHIAPHLLYGYQSADLPDGPNAFVATMEKALLDLAHLTPNSDNPDFLNELRLQNLERLDLKQLKQYARRSKKPKWLRVVGLITEMAVQERDEYEELS